MHFLTFCSTFNVVFFLYAFEFKSVHGLFNKTSCYLTNCVQQDSQGRWCYALDPRTSTDVECIGGHGRDASMSAVMAVHLKQGLSIAYYSGIDNVLLGGADFPFPTSGGIVNICVSGKAGDGSFQTFCENIHQDNDIYGSVGDPFCIVAVGQDVVTDGCYVPKSGVVMTSAGPIHSSTTTASPIASTKTLSSAIKTTTITAVDGTTKHHGSTTTITTTTDGTKQTVVVVSNSGDNRGFNYGKNVVLPIVLAALLTAT